MTKEFPKPKFEECKARVGLCYAAAMHDDGEYCVKTAYVRSGGKWHKTVGGKLQMLSGPAGMATPLIKAEQTKVPKKIERPGFDSWVIDTGSGYHLAPRNKLSKEERSGLHTDLEILLHTANGITAGRHATTSTIAELGDLSADVRVLKDTPRVLSVKLLVQSGFTFSWGEFGASLTHPDGTVTELEVKGGVPLLALPAPPAVASAAAKSTRRQRKKLTKTVAKQTLNKDTS